MAAAAAAAVVVVVVVMVMVVVAVTLTVSSGGADILQRVARRLQPVPVARVDQLCYCSPASE